MTPIIYALLLAFVWTLIVGSASLEVFGVGFGAGLALAWLLKPEPLPGSWRALPAQAGALLLYVAALFRDIFISGIDVARRVLSPDMRLQPGIIAVSTQDPERGPVILALSANYITLTPGELVVEVEDDHVMYIHCLDVEASAAGADEAQARRLRLLKSMLGRDDE